MFVQHRRGPALPRPSFPHEGVTGTCRPKTSRHRDGSRPNRAQHSPVRQNKHAEWLRLLRGIQKHVRNTGESAARDRRSAPISRADHRQCPGEAKGLQASHYKETSRNSLSKRQQVAPDGPTSLPHLSWRPCEAKKRSIISMSWSSVERRNCCAVSSMWSTRTSSTSQGDRIRPKTWRASGKLTRQDLEGPHTGFFQDCLDARLSGWGPAVRKRRFWQFRGTFAPGSTARTGSSDGALSSSPRLAG